MKLVATRCLTKYARKLPLQDLNLKSFTECFDPLLNLVDISQIECIRLQIDAFTVLSKLDEAAVSEIAYKVTPKMLSLFKNHH